ncbi:hypothetical protein HUG17_1070 [Dermatophagoides farinae]|uniref:SAM domain-containing protein n=1 Tax=Dermatophagoides farinae TaxID=6954 RepID=A0A9D4SKW8_DERFA|nr:uncharacterized protein LOC124499765 isoform X1 [Dermatophagoides farinae]KAH7645532.1 hypothetical protein HUG17_1070 [Dermatophagoides farinae]
MEEVKRRLAREGINISVFTEENVDLATFLALTREDLIDLNFSVIKTRKILMIQEEIRSRHSKPASSSTPKTNTGNNVRSQSQSLTEVVNNTIMTPVTVNDTTANYSIVTIPSSNYDNHQMMTNVDNNNEVDDAAGNIHDTNDTNSSNGDMVQVALQHHEYNSTGVSNEMPQQLISLADVPISGLAKRHSDGFQVLQNLDFRSLLAQDDQGTILLEVLDRGDYLNKRLPNTFVKVVANVADDFIYRTFGLRYPFDVGLLMVEKIYDSIGYRCVLGEKREWFGLRKGNNRIGRIHSRNEKRKRLNREYNTSISYETAYIRFKTPKHAKKSM